ncbi:MAG: RNA methyltransferase [Deltaproteobacteria bacterium]|nr:RNA methyltransferase [Deltaproteobacteria bacterium]
MLGAKGMSFEVLSRIAETLAPYLTPARIKRMDDTIAGRTRDVVLVLEDILDEHNASAVLRTAEALGVLEVHFIVHRHPFKLTHKITRGAHKWLDLRGHDSTEKALSDLKARDYTVWAADVRAPAEPLESVSASAGKVALVFGNEHAGLSDEAMAASDGCFCIPMHGFVESLNISVAAAVALYDVLAHRRRAGACGPLSPLDQAAVRAVWYTSSVRAAAQLLAEQGLPAPIIARSHKGLVFVDTSPESDIHAHAVSSCDPDVQVSADVESDALGLASSSRPR